ncbi:hypothetical protein CPAST_c19250 [Clostridium pasteurianum DSM 525 = ATCC 6013]|uniref:Uncharacterized protein n=1 Tax=Clostridium pasteurianum DSM 525 = ATCC 6013 TaxID=1262449 RepID=A0A0H3J9U9_CLOPA|nr:hypothetical protein CPAST_c19250 [Clostridium pasteurianum DSM 525 = ATCC 6013]AOZ79075.1 endonuclease III [Clostridium pasteurianum]AJA51983.1 hypothetical protein CLPA_c19250 [Clostridium pasteurianum DSM 525 = ATCC 6013]AOZ75280.1 endonuclease III [Clostridium pasteurianum DSM 525 = ATCC 6013]ELP59898.1 hypothetical protein F502_08533 [Clostridium pasteurianum DSM 525 = ATCC 6013]
MIEKTEFIEFIILAMKCFLILIFLGIILPKLVDYSIYFFITKSEVHNNSILVYNVLKIDKRIIYNFIYLFKLATS